MQHWGQSVEIIHSLGQTGCRPEFVVSHDSFTTTRGAALPAIKEQIKCSLTPLVEGGLFLFTTYAVSIL